MLPVDADLQTGRSLAALSSTGCRREDDDSIDDSGCSLHAHRGLLSDLLEVVGGEASDEVEVALARETGDLAESKVTTAPKPFLSLPGDDRKVHTPRSLRVRAEWRERDHDAVSKGS
jgi:hypothetical protein